MSTFKQDFYTGSDFGKALCAHYGLSASKVFDLKIHNADDDVFQASLSIMLGPDDLTSIAAHMRGDAPDKEAAITVKVDASQALCMLASVLEPGAVLMSADSIANMEHYSWVKASDLVRWGGIMSTVENDSVEVEMAPGGALHQPQRDDTLGPDGSEVIHVEDAAEPAPIHYVYLTEQQCSAEQRMWAVGVDDTDKVTRYAIPTDQLTGDQMVEHGARIRTL